MGRNRILILCLVVLLTACSTVMTPQTTREPLQPTPERITEDTAVTQTPVVATATALPPTSAPTPTVAEQLAATSVPVDQENGTVTAATIAIEREEGSGTICTANATYFVHASITTDGPATASFEISSLAGQIAAGNFEDVNNQTLSPSVSGKLIFTQADTKTMNLRFVGPYPYPGDITVVLRVNGGEFHHTKLSCQG